MAIEIELNEYLQSCENRIGSLARGYAILVGTLHDAGIIDGTAIVRSLRLDAQVTDTITEASLLLADMVQGTIDKVECEGPSGLKAVDSE